MKTVATKKALTPKRTPKQDWGERLFEVLRGASFSDIGKLDRLEELILDQEYQDDKSSDFWLEVNFSSDQGDWEDFTEALNITATQFPGNCGILVAHDLPDMKGKEAQLWTFYFDLLNAIAHKLKYGLVMVSHLPSHPSMKAASAYGFRKLNICHNPNSGNTITVMSRVVTSPTDNKLKKLVSDVSR